MKNNTGGKKGRRVFGPPPLGRSGATTDEDLVLFRELHKREKDRIASLLLPVSEEFELSGSTNYYHHAALFRIPSNKKSSLGLEFLTGIDKNDYDWLKTPPATPLFPSLEMEAATAPEMAVQRQLPIMQPLSRFSSSSYQVPKQRQNQAYPNPKTPSTNKPKPSPTPIKTSTTPKPYKPTINHITPRHPDPLLKSNLSKPESTSTRPKSRGSASVMVERPSSDQTPTDERSLSSSRRVISNDGSGVLRGGKAGSKPKNRVVSSNGGRASETTTPLRSTGVRMGEGVTMPTATQPLFFGSKMVDKVMSARKGGNGDVAERMGEGFGRVAARSSIDMAVKPTLESMRGLRRSCKITTKPK